MFEGNESSEDEDTVDPVFAEKRERFMQMPRRIRKLARRDAAQWYDDFDGLSANEEEVYRYAESWANRFKESAPKISEQMIALIVEFIVHLIIMWISEQQVRAPVVSFWDCLD